MNSKIFLLSVVTAVVAALSALAGGEENWQKTTVGAQVCAKCHKEIYDRWKNTRHAKSLSALSKEERKDKHCLSCHSPFDASDLEGVQCESCHGAGAQYAKDYVMKDKKLAAAVGLEPNPGKIECGRCHSKDSPKLKPLDVDKAKSEGKEVCQPKKKN